MQFDYLGVNTAYAKFMLKEPVDDISYTSIGGFSLKVPNEDFKYIYFDWERFLADKIMNEEGKVIGMHFYLEFFDKDFFEESLDDDVKSYEELAKHDFNILKAIKELELDEICYEACYYNPEVSLHEKSYEMDLTELVIGDYVFPKERLEKYAKHLEEINNLRDMYNI